MMKNYLAAIAAGALLLASSAAAQEKKIKQSELPPAVEKTVAAKSAGATIRGFPLKRKMARLSTKWK